MEIIKENLRLKAKRKLAEYRENTVRHNDKRWEKKYQFVQDNRLPEVAYDYNWDGFIFGNMGWDIPFRGKFLDIGCGSGNFCRYIKAKCIYMDVWGIDFSPNAIKRGKELAEAAEMKINLVCGDALNLPFETETFDYVTNMEIIEHVKDPNKFLKEIQRVLKPGGLVITMTPWRGLILKNRLVGHREEWTPSELIDLINKYFEFSKASIPPVFKHRGSNQTIYSHWFAILANKKNE